MSPARHRSALLPLPLCTSTAPSWPRRPSPTPFSDLHTDTREAPSEFMRCATSNRPPETWSRLWRGLPRRARRNCVHGTRATPRDQRLAMPSLSICRAYRTTFYIPIHELIRYLSRTTCSRLRAGMCSMNGCVSSSRYTCRVEQTRDVAK